jgi:hypothetical protein
MGLPEVEPEGYLFQEHPLELLLHVKHQQKKNSFVLFLVIYPKGICWVNWKK